MPEIGTSGSMSGDGKRGAGHRPQATAPILDSTIAVQGVSHDVSAAAVTMMLPMRVFSSNLKRRFFDHRCRRKFQYPTMQILHSCAAARMISICDSSSYLTFTTWDAEASASMPLRSRPCYFPPLWKSTEIGGGITLVLANSAACPTANWPTSASLVPTSTESPGKKPARPPEPAAFATNARQMAGVCGHHRSHQSP
jgi:hypothetical protein